MAAQNVGVCDGCSKRVPAEHVIRDGKVYFVRHCPDCGDREGLVSSDAEVWQWKRDIYGYTGDEPIGCSLACDTCGRDHEPKLLFLDVTNRCNMNCPICLANIPGMGFEFHPPLEYFERIFEILGTWDPKPRVQLFGGEPTVRRDLFEIIDLAKKHGVRVCVVTNGIKLADEDYCRQLCDANVQLLLSYDGPEPETYERLRANRESGAKKAKAVENVAKFSKRQHTLLCAVAQGVNDHCMPDVFAFAHEHRKAVKRIHFLPLCEMWAPGTFHVDQTTTSEDLERILDGAFPDESLEFLPAGLTSLAQPAFRFFSKGTLRFAGIHPNCESATYVISDGERYHPIGYVLKRPLRELAGELAERAKKLNPRLAKLDPDKWFQRWRGRLMALGAFGWPILRSLRYGRLAKRNPVMALLRILGGLLIGRRVSEQMRRHTYVSDMCLSVVLPFEEVHSLEAARLDRCTVCFCYLDPDTDQLETVPFCAWTLYRADVFRRIAAKYAAQPAPGQEAGAEAAVS